MASDTPQDAPLRDHRPHLCNADDFMRIVNVPQELYANFRDMPGVVTHADSEWEWLVVGINVRDDFVPLLLDLAKVFCPPW